MKNRLGVLAWIGRSRGFHLPTGTNSSLLSPTPSKVAANSRTGRFGADVAVCPTNAGGTFILMGGPQGHGDAPSKVAANSRTWRSAPPRGRLPHLGAFWRGDTPRRPRRDAWVSPSAEAEMVVV